MAGGNFRRVLIERGVLLRLLIGRFRPAGRWRLPHRVPGVQGLQQQNAESRTYGWFVVIFVILN